SSYFSRYAPHPDLHSFPTRRSSDLNRIYVQDGVYDAFAQKLAAEVAKLKVGRGTEAGVTTGPLINKAGVEKVEEHIADATAKGRSEEHTSELQSRENLVCRLLLEKK